MFKKYFFFFPVIIIFLSNCYYISEGYQLINTYLKAEKIDKIIKKDNIPDDEKELFLLIKNIKEYAVNNLELKDNNNYTKYIKINKNYLVDVVTACKSDSFNQYNWNYLIMGKMPYKGFFKYIDAIKEAKKLKKDNYDVYIGKVDAFSTLGILSDPIFSFMKSYSIYELADIIFHEQTHSTLFLEEQIDFNENLANFIGTEGALLFIKDNYGIESDIYKNTINIIDDSNKFRKLINNLYEELSLIYIKNILKEEKLYQKELTINNWKEKFKNNYKKEFKTNTYKRIPNIEINNAYITIFRSYTKDLSIFYELYKVCDDDLKKFIQIIKNLKSYKGDPKIYIKNYINEIHK